MKFDPSFILAKYKNVEKVFQVICNTNPLQKKKVDALIKNSNTVFWDDFEDFLEEYSLYLTENAMHIEYAIESYLKICSQMIKCQIYFLRTGKYPVNNSSEALESVYLNKNQMTLYMIGLALSQYLWTSHYQMYSFVRQHFAASAHSFNSYLEIGPGHGLHLKAAMQSMSHDARVVAIDISPVALDISRSLIQSRFPDRNVEYINIDMVDLDSTDTYDFITMGEVLEHVNKPDILLRKLLSLLAPSGQAYISTCVNAPAVDHVFHFHTIDEIRELLKISGFSIIKELVAPVEELPMEEIMEKKIAINYCAILERG